MQAGAMLAIPSAVDIGGQFVGGSFEAALVARNLRARTVWSTCLGLAVTVHVTCMLGFGWATSRQPAAAAAATLATRTPTARLPLLCYCLVMATMGLNQSSWQQGYLDVGGTELEMVSAVGNMAANMPGVLVPWLGAALRTRFAGSWLPLFSLVAALHGATGLYFIKAMHDASSVETGYRREQKST
jgi:hypothetical protein